MSGGSKEELKDERLVELAEKGNVAQFVSFGPGSDGIRHHRIAGVPSPSAPDQAVRGILAASGSGTVNIRTFRAGDQKGQPFVYGVASVDEALALVRSFAKEGYFTIVNETIDVNDGGVSGVALGDVVEFAPGSTPRAVEGEGVASLPRGLGLAMLKTVYGFEPALPADPALRVEFSVHPSRVGFLGDHTILWEVEDVGEVSVTARPDWPNKFSEYIGDKVFGLLVAHLLGLRVPRATVIGREVAPFTFGQSTGTREVWLRTSPRRQEPGLFTTQPRWVDPFALLASEDPQGQVAAVLAQDGVDAVWSGATLPTPSGHIVEGVRGRGLEYMQGAVAVEEIPAKVAEAVEEALAPAVADLGPVRSEWVHDGKDVWIVQLHVSREAVREPDVLSPGEAGRWLDFNVADGLPRLRELIENAKQSGSGVRVHGRVGLTSHVGDLLRKERVPARRFVSESA